MSARGELDVSDEAVEIPEEYLGANKDDFRFEEYYPDTKPCEPLRAGTGLELLAAHLSDLAGRLTQEHDRTVVQLSREIRDLRAELREARASAAKAAGTKCLSPVPAATLGRAPPGAGGQVPDNGERFSSPKEDARGNLDLAQAAREPSAAAAGKAKPKPREDTNDTDGPLSKRRRCARFVQSAKFDLLIGTVIGANTIVMCLQLEYRGRLYETRMDRKCMDCNVEVPAIHTAFELAEHIFTAVFALELLFRLAVLGPWYLHSLSNFLDAVIVIVSMVDSWILGPMGSDALGSVAFLRLVRLLRLAKVLRVVRVMKAFSSLRVLVRAVANSVGALAWSMTLLFVLELVGAIFMAQVLQPFIEDESLDDSLRIFIWRRFGTWTNAMFTIFEVTMAPGGFVQYRRLYEEVHALFGVFFVIYVCGVTFAVVRVISAMFLKATLSASATDEVENAQERAEEWAHYVREMQQEIDSDNDGTIGIRELRHLLSEDTFQRWITELGCNGQQVERVWHALDHDESGQVAFANFEKALRQMKEHASQVEIVTNLLETSCILSRVTRLLDTRGAGLPGRAKSRGGRARELDPGGEETTALTATVASSC